MNIIGISVSIAFVLCVIVLCTVLEKMGKLSGEGSRKFIHIAVCNWWFIAMAFFNDPIWAAFVPLLFVIVNYLSYKHQLIQSMERGGGKEDLGTVYYAISLLILSFITFKIKQPFIGGLGILIMGYADGFAAIVGQKWPRPKVYLNKSLAGTCCVWVISTAVSATYFQLYSPSISIFFALVIGILATILELYSPKGLDNLTLPLGTSGLYYLIIHNFI